MVLADRDQLDSGVVIIFIFYFFMGERPLFISSSLLIEDLT